MPFGLPAETLRGYDPIEALIIQCRSEGGALLQVFLPLSVRPSPRGDNQLMKEKGFRDRKAHGESIENRSFREIQQNADEGKWYCVEIPLMDGKSVDITSSWSMNYEFDFVAGGGELLNPFRCDEVNEAEISDRPFEVGPHLFV